MIKMLNKHQHLLQGFFLDSLFFVCVVNAHRESLTIGNCQVCGSQFVWKDIKSENLM